MRALTIRQPWASLIAHGIKTIETRSWSTKYRGPILIHAGLTMPDLTWEGGGYSIATRHDHNGRVPFLYREFIGEDQEISLPLGAVVAVAYLTDVVPIVGAAGCTNGSKHLCVVGVSALLHSALDTPWPDGQTEHIVSDQLPFGDFAPGRYGWLLDDVRPLAAPIPAKGRQGLWTPDDDLARRIHQETDRG